MEFWGAEVKSGQMFEVELEDDGSRILHLSQAALGEVTGDSKKEKGSESVCIYLKFNNEKFVIGTLSQEKFPQIPLDLVLHGKFELSHTWKNGSVYLIGYYVDTSQGGDSESEEELPEPTINSIKPHATAYASTTPKQVKIVEPKKEEDSSDDDDEDEDEDDTSAEDEESTEDQEQGMLVNGENESDDDTDSDDDGEEESSDEDQETPETEKAGPSKKRPAESATKTPAPEKKAKLVTPQKTDGKKVSGHTATPHPSKQAGNASVATGQVKQTSKSGGSSFPCKSCGRSFGSEHALQSHSKAKHSGAM